MAELSEEQQDAFDAIIHRRVNLLLFGPAGCGKSHLIRALAQHCRMSGTRTIAVTAMTGTAAVLLECCASTLHRWAGIKLGDKSAEFYISEMRKKTISARRACSRWRDTDLLVIDEVSMMKADLLDKLDKIGRAIRGNPVLPFGGLQVVLSGDFFQLGPIFPRVYSKPAGAAPPPPLIAIHCFRHPQWADLIQETYLFETIHRQTDPAFKELLNKVRVGDYDDEVHAALCSRLIPPPEDGPIKPTRLMSLKDSVETINTTELDALPGPRQVYKIKTIVGTDDICAAERLQIDALVEQHDANANYVIELTLAMDAQVMLLYNLDTEGGLVNGSRGVVVGFDPVKGFPIVLFKNGRTERIAPHSWEVGEIRPRVLVWRAQVPLRLAYALTIHKGQGASLDSAVVRLDDTVFAPGQFYTALSRVRTLDGLYIEGGLNPEGCMVDPHVLTWYQSLYGSDDDDDE